MLYIHRRLRLYHKGNETQDQKEGGVNVLLAHGIGARVGGPRAECAAAGVEGGSGATIRHVVIGAAAVFFAEQRLLRAPVRGPM